MPATERVDGPEERRFDWSVRSIAPGELPATCRFCRPRPRPEPAVAVISCKAKVVWPSGAQMSRGERSAPVCVDHGVDVQQRYILGQAVPT